MPESLGTHRVTYQHRMKFCSRPSCAKGCRSGVPSHGPYWYASWREGGRVRTRYLGKQVPPGTPAIDEPRQAARARRQPPLRMQTLGTFAIWRGSERLPVHTWGTRMRALFALLLESVERPRTREQLAVALWPDLAPAAASKGVRQTLSRLRQALDRSDLPHSYIRGRKGQLVLDPAPNRPTPPSWWDVPTFRAAAAGALAGSDLTQGRDALACYGGDFLPGEELLEVEIQRARLHADFVALLLHQARTAASQAELDEAEACLHQILALEPTHEEAGRALMVLLAHASRRAEALKVYQDLARGLDEDLGIAPDAQTQRLAAKLTEQGQRTTVAPLRPSEPSSPPLGNLVHPATPFVGRLAARAAIAVLLDEQRLVTLSGTGGIGKTRLAVQVGHDLLERFPDGIWQVEFAGLPANNEGGDLGMARLVPALARTLGIDQRSDQPLTTTLAAFLRPRVVLLILDNCEHVCVPAAGLATWLLAQCPRVRLLLTSRAPLEVPEETVWQVPPFTLPDPGAELTTLAATEAVRFFVTRARAVRGNFRLEPATAGAVVQICHRLDGMPLALEFAAARLRLLEIGELATRLDDRFRLLTGNNPLALPRQQTLRATLDWSYALLTVEARVLLCRVSVFVGGWTPAAAETVCAHPPLATSSILDLLDELVRHSLVLVDRWGSVETTRYRMLETVREYGRLQLAAANEQAAVSITHRRWCLSLARAAEAHLRDHEQGRWLDRLEAEHDNLQAALAWSCAEPAADRGQEGIEIAAAIWQFWYMHNHWASGRAWFERLFAAFSAAFTPLWAKALNAAGGLAVHDNDLPRAKELLKASLDTARQIGDRRGAARALTNLAAAYHAQGAYAEAETWYEESLGLFRGLADRPNEAIVLLRLGGLAKNRREYQRAQILFEEALTHWRTLGNSYIQSSILDGLADIAWRSGELERAANLSEESMRLAREISNDFSIASALHTKALIAKAEGEHAKAADLLYASLDIRQRAGAHSAVADVLDELAGLVAALPRMTDQASGTAGRGSLWAAELLGATAAMRSALNMPVNPEYIGEYEADISSIRQCLGESAFSDAWNRGAALSSESAIALAVKGLGLHHGIAATG